MLRYEIDSIPSFLGSWKTLQGLEGWGRGGGAVGQRNLAEQRRNKMSMTGARYTVGVIQSSVLNSCFKIVKSFWFLKSQGNGPEDRENVN